MNDINIVGPLGPDNFERGDKALRAVAAYARNSLDVSDPDELLEVGENNVLASGNGAPIAYLIADLCHLMRRYDIGVEEFINHSFAHFGSDVIEQAFFADAENWTNTLQDAENMERAKLVMTTAGVPESAHEAALRYVGLLPPLEREE